MSNSEFSSLSSLTFDPKLRSGWNASYFQNIRLVILILITVIALGVVAFMTLPRRLNPEVKLTIVRVSTVLPGAGPEDVESLVTRPLEDALDNVKGIDTMTSVSRDNFSLIVLQFLSSVQKDKARNDVQTAISEVTTLPDDAQTPSVAALDFEDQPIWTFSLTGDTDPGSLMRFTDALKTDIESIPGVDRVTLSGFETQEIQIIINPETARVTGLSPTGISGAISTALSSYPAGSVESDGSTFSLSVDPSALSVDDIRSTIVSVHNTPMKLGDIAKIVERPKAGLFPGLIGGKNTSPMRSVQVSVYKSSDSDIDTTVKRVESFVDTYMKSAPESLRVITVVNSGEEITKQFSELIDEFKSTIILVAINLTLFLGLRQALIACMTIPLTFLLSFFWMSVLGQTVNFISLFAFLLAFGTSIDDTIVTVSAMSAYYKTKRFTPEEAALLVWRDFVIPIWTTTATTVWAFLPLILSTGIIGEFIKPIPLIVSTTMYSSTFIAWFITLPMMIVFLSPTLPKRVKTFGIIILSTIVIMVLYVTIPKTVFFIPTLILIGAIVALTYTLRIRITVYITTHITSAPAATYLRHIAVRLFDHGLIDTARLGNFYGRWIKRILTSPHGTRKVVIAIITFVVVSYSLVPLGLVKNEFFPKSNGDTLYVSYELPAGTGTAVMEAASRKLMDDLRDTPETTWVTADIGTAIGANGSPSQSPNTTLFTLILAPKETRTRTSGQIATLLRDELRTNQSGAISVIEESGGPPAGADVQIKILGQDLSKLERYSEALMEFLKKQPGIINVDTTMKTGTGKLVFIPDESVLTSAGVSRGAIALALRTAASGFPLDTVKFDGKTQATEIVYLSGQEIASADDIGRIEVPSSQGGQVPLVSLGKLVMKTNPTVINREDGKRVVSVSAGVLPGYSVSDANTRLIDFAKNSLALEDGYEWKTGGVNEENQKSVMSIFRAMAFSFILIMATMVIEFRSYRQAAIILILIPIAISGVFIIFGLTGTPLSFPALIGILALFGVVVTNAMFIVEKINQNTASGMSTVDAIVDAGQSRLEPIMLTSLTSILGLVPITIANPLWRGLGGAIISGLFFSGIIMLLYIPVMYSILFGKTKDR